ncbi:hypothetical protein R5R35_000190 [Gryllus longicercus]|uniref:Uncharacterized protein n=1 Tax=Gryllus longicercus TaxID=2509291 RepID=A0AAN9ZHF7_9ORTH
MSANAANIQMSYAAGELPAQTPPAPVPSTPPAPSPQQASVSSPAKSQATPEPAVPGPSATESADPDTPRFSAIGKQLWVTAGTQTPTRQDGDASPGEAAGEAAFPTTEEQSEKEEASSESAERVSSGSEEELFAPSGSMFLDHLRTLPVVRCSTNLYARVRSNGLLSVPLALLECSATLAAMPVKMAALPFQAFCPTSLFLLDWTLYKGLDTLLAVCPCIAAPLNQVNLSRLHSGFDPVLPGGPVGSTVPIWVVDFKLVAVIFVLKPKTAVSTAFAAALELLARL